MNESLDHPFAEVVAQVEHLRRTRPGVLCYQKFTCAGCGNRLGIEEPYRFYTQGTCDECDAITNIEKQGCNYILVMTVEAP